MYRQAKFRPIFVVVGLPSDFGRDFEIFGHRRRGRLPFEAGSRPWIGSSDGTVAHGPDKINHGEQVAEREDGGSGGGHHIEDLELRRIAGIAARHAQVAKNKLREEGEIEAKEQGDGGDAREKFRVEFAGNLGPPEMKSADVTHDRAADHDVVEVGDYEISVVEMNVQTEAGEEKTGKSADNEEADKAEGVQHRRVVGDRTLRERWGPVEGLECGGDDHHIAEQRDEDSA